MALLKEQKQFGGAPTYDYYFECDGCGAKHYPANQFKPTPPAGWLETCDTGGNGQMRVKHFCKKCVEWMKKEQEKAQ